MQKNSTQYIRNSSCYWCKVGEEVVVLEPASGTYLGLSAVASSLWESMGEAKTLAALVKQTIDEYDVDPDTASQDISALLNEMQDKHLVSSM